jgi:ABC-type uncharacterized transport system involved in gliding motility auxiliary subunit
LSHPGGDKTMKTSSKIATWMASLSAVSGFFIYAIAPDKTTPALILLFLTVFNTLLLAVLEKKSLSRVLKTRSAAHGANSLILAVIFLSILVFINLIAFRHNQQFDFTESGFYTLSPQTKKIIASLPREVRLTAFFQIDSPEKKLFQDRMQSILESSDKINLSFIDPDKNPAITKQYGITTYGTVVFESGKKESKVRDPNEANLIKAIIKVTKNEQKVIRFLEGHGEKRIDDFENQGYSTVKSALEKDGFKVEKSLLLKSGEIPSNTKLLVIPGPEKPILPQELKIIQGYLKGGGSVLLLLDPQSKAGVEGFLKEWGINAPDSFVIDPMSKLFGGDYAAPVVSQYVAHEITNNFALPTIFPLLRTVTAIKSTEADTTEFLLTGANSWGEINLDDLKDGKSQFDEKSDIQGPVAVGVISTRKTPNKGIRELESNNKKKSTSKQKNIQKAHLTVIGDSDFAGNQYFNFSGNGDLFLNVASFLTEEENLISIRPKERKNSPLSLTSDQGIFILMLGLLTPSFVIFIGVRTWWRRRHL